MKHTLSLFGFGGMLGDIGLIGGNKYIIVAIDNLDIEKETIDVEFAEYSGPLPAFFEITSPSWKKWEKHGEEPTE
jgi:hypothetical protein